MKKIFFFVGIIIIVVLVIFSISNVTKKTAPVSTKISIITTLFPQYDFAKAIGGNKVNVKLLLPPGIEAHAYEPKPSDITEINKAGIFVYTGEFMEPWAHDIIESVDKKVKIIDASLGIETMQVAENKDEEHEEAETEEVHHHHGGVDPHIWLDFDNAQKMAENITKALVEVDPRNASYYQANLKACRAKLLELNNGYKKTLATCKSRTVVYGGHYAFGYLARKYDLKYEAAQGFSPDAEPTAKDLITLIEQIKKEKISHIFYEELTSPKIAETLAKETNTKLLLLNGGHNLSKEDYETGETFVSLMEKNLANLALGLDCQK